MTATPAVDEKVPVARSMERVEVIELPDAGRSGATKYAYVGTEKLSIYSFDTPLSKSKTDMPTSASPGNVIGSFIAGQPYARRFVSFAAPLQHVTFVHMVLKQLQPEA